VDMTYCILEHGNQDPSVRPLRNWMLYSQSSHCKLDILLIRWRVAIDALLLKKAGVTLVKKLRTIVLFQVDFNYLKKYIGRHMMKDGEAYTQLAWDQYGSREGNNAIEQALNKVISFDLIRQARMDAAMCSYHAKSC
jgi:hypothetical protein